MKYFLGLFLMIYSLPSFADGIGFTNVTESQYKKIVEEIGAAWMHTSVSPASSLGDVLGFEVGLVAGATATETVAKLADDAEPDSEVDNLPHAGLLGALTVPFGITLELNLLPEINNSEVDFSTGSFGIKWTITDVWELPVDLALKLHSSKSELKWNQIVSATATDVSYEQEVIGLMFQVSKKFTVFEPYVSIGTVNTKGTLKSESGTVFDSSFTAESSAEEEVKGGMLQIGANVNLMFFKIGLETGKIMDAQRTSLKLSVFF